MALKILSLSELITSDKELQQENHKKIQNLLNTFKSISVSGKDSAHDVETFLKNKALQFDKQGISRTHLVLSTYQEKTVLVGYFTINNKPLVFTKRMLNNCSATLKKKLNNKGFRNNESDNLIINGFLIAQLGKNYSEEALKTKAISGRDLLTLARDMILDVQKISAGSYIWVEYEDIDRLRTFYNDFGFREIDNHLSENNLKMAIMKV